MCQWIYGSRFISCQHVDNTRSSNFISYGELDPSYEYSKLLMVWSKNRPRTINQGHMRIGSSLQNTSWASALRLFFHVCHMHCHAILVADNTQDPGTEKCKGVQKSTFHLGSWQVTRRMTCMHTLCFYGRRVDSLTLIVSNEAYIIRLNRTLHGKLQDGLDGFLIPNIVSMTRGVQR